MAKLAKEKTKKAKTQKKFRQNKKESFIESN